MDTAQHDKAVAQEHNSGIGGGRNGLWRRWRRQWRLWRHRYRSSHRNNTAAFSADIRHMQPVEPPEFCLFGAQRMVSVSRNVACIAQRRALQHGADLYRRADRHCARAGQRQVLHLHHLDCRGECVFLVGCNCRVRHPPALSGQPRFHHGSIRGSARASGGY